MASYHCHVRPGPKGKGAEHAQSSTATHNLFVEAFSLGNHTCISLGAWRAAYDSCFGESGTTRPGLDFRDYQRELL